ncbi:MAG TPA: SRPBCC domain-containing protein [Candidatus Methylomirabilis sp.]|nr:SRPBCC domain-containing protein [Candidatus Methylomirabilis sp.]
MPIPPLSESETPVTEDPRGLFRIPVTGASPRGELIRRSPGKLPPKAGRLRDGPTLERKAAVSISTLSERTESGSLLSPRHRTESRRRLRLQLCGTRSRGWGWTCCRLRHAGCDSRCRARCGRVLVWEPPHRIVLSWDIGAGWKYDPELGTEVEVRFISEGPDTTRVELEHRRLERYGAQADTMRATFDSERGWSGILRAFAQAAAKA